MAEQPTLVGVTFGEISLRFADAVPLGVKSLTTGVRLNPENDYVFEEGDELVVLAEDDDTYAAAPTVFNHSEDPVEVIRDSNDHSDHQLPAHTR